MSELKHTPGPWEAWPERPGEEVGFGFATTYVGSVVGIPGFDDLLDLEDGEESDDFGSGEANAARIVACVNACDRAGLSNEALDGDVIKELVEAIKTVRPGIEMWYRSHVDLNGEELNSLPYLKVIDDVLAKVK